MKLRYLLLPILVLYAFNLTAQQVTQTRVAIEWKGLENWTIGTSNTQVIAFKDALYPDNKLPNYHTRIEIKDNKNYSVQVQQCVLSLCNASEIQIIGNQNLTSSPKVTAEEINIDGKRYLDIIVLPFVTRENNTFKVDSFTLNIEKLQSISKVTSSTLHSYSSESVLAQGKFVKIKVSDSGVYKLTYETLNSLGITPNDVRIFGYGGGVLEQNFALSKIDDLPEVAIYMNKGSDNIFNAGDYILFYAQGPTKWSYDNTTKTFAHTINSYSQYGYYFITSDTGTGKRIEEKTIAVSSNKTTNTISEFTDCYVHEVEKINLAQSGREFYGETFNDATSLILSIQTPNAVSMSARLNAAANSSVSSYFSLALNGAQQKNLSISARPSTNYAVGADATGSYTFSSPTDNSVFTLTYSRPNSTSIGYLNYLELNIRRKLIMSGNPMQFQNIDYIGGGSYNKYQLTSATANIQIWDITDQQNITKIASTLDGSTLSFTDSGNELHNYIAIDPTASSAFSSPDIVGTVTNQNLHAINQADMLIITHPDFVSQANELAQLHRDQDGLTCEVVTTEQVYNEFSSGTPDATAYRWIMKMLYDRAKSSGVSSDLPKYLLLFGTGTYDNRKIMSNSGSNLILTFQSENSLTTISPAYVTDDYYGMLEDSEGAYVPSGTLEIGIGRFPVYTSAQASIVVSKIKSYMTNASKGLWKNQLCFLADDGDQALHMQQADNIASSVSKINPSFQVNKIYLDAFQQQTSASGSSYPLAKTKFMNLLRNGLLYLNYTGHASANGWADEGILTISDVKKLSNTKLPLFFGATCDFLEYDSGTISAGEYVLTNASGGGIGIISAARPVYAIQNMTLNKYFTENLFRATNGVMPRVGDALKAAKNSIGTEINKLIYVYMGDPALRLDYPNNYQIITESINNNTVIATDTLKALSVANIKGYVADYNGNKATDFNGTIHTVVYDKEQSITTLNNEGDGSLTYTDRPNTLFSGSNVVRNGEFSVAFMVPKDIRYNYGTGRINYYAVDSISKKEGQGYNQDFYIGGTDPDYTNETNGPDVSLFLNSTYFKSGDNVNETPLFIANVSDSHGINTVGSGIGHDISICIDNDPSLTYVLNDYYTASQGSYSQGTILYQIPEMTEGKHTLTFKVWDLLNNSTTTDVNFKVIKGLSPDIYNIYVYPNPVKSSNTAKIVISHNRPEIILYTTVDIFDIAGRKVWTFSQTGADNISWDLTTLNGIKLSTGAYLCRVSIKTADSDICSKTAKILITE